MNNNPRTVTFTLEIVDEYTLNSMTVKVDYDCTDPAAILNGDYNDLISTVLDNLSVIPIDYDDPGEDWEDD